MAGESAEKVYQGAFDEGIDLSQLEGMMLRNYRSLKDARIHDSDRLEDLYGSRFWAQPEVGKLNEFCSLAVRILSVMAAHVMLVGESESRIIASSDPSLVDFTEPVDWSYCSNVVGAQRTLSIDDAREHKLVCDLPSTKEMGIRAYLGVPLIGKGGRVLGSFCVVDDKPRQWSSYDVTWLTQIAGAMLSFHEHAT